VSGQANLALIFQRERKHSRHRSGRAIIFNNLDLLSASAVCTENLIRVDDVMESPKLAE
jgi:hypothetical protein